jgi:nitroreductase
MELREVMGRRRSIRFLRPYKPVEPWKVQYMLEAARIASHWGNVQSLRAVVVFRNTAPAEVIEQLQATVLGWQLRIAPVVIVWYVDPQAVDEQSDRLRELVNRSVMGFGDAETRRRGLEEELIPFFEKVLPRMKLPGLNEIDCGQGIAQATLAAFEVGLGTCCLGTPRGPALLKALGVPEHCRVLLLQTVGYPLEDPDAGGQRPRLPFERLFSLNGYGQPFPRDPQVVGQLQRDGMLREPAPLDYREAELEFMRQALGLTAPGLLR